MAEQDDDEGDDADDGVGGGGNRDGGGGPGGAGGPAGAQQKKKKKKTTYKLLMLKHPTTGVMTPIFFDRLANVFASRQLRNGGKALDPNLSFRMFAAATDGANAPLMVVSHATDLFSRKHQRLIRSSIDLLRNDVTNIFSSSTDDEKERDACMLEALLPMQVGIIYRYILLKPCPLILVVSRC